ncbi:MAG: acyl-CoA dehydratase activase-related protein, partial [Propionibacteriaceae bacterium]|nr:acyl-CoA dehydratase activase-related protein [Propionibacteriaceae bacterium]
VQPLLNQGAAHSDIAASVFQAVANQTIAGLACGHPITGNVILLGGPLHFLPQLREAYRRALGSRVTSLQAPEDGQLYVAMGAAMLAKEPALSLSHLIDGLRKAENQTLTKTMRPLFLDERERAEFDTRHAQHRIPRGRLSEAVGPVYVGIDAGSTTIKSVVIDESRSILFSTYGSNEGDPVAAALAISRQIREALPADAYIARACVTGYGEALVQAATHADAGVIETMAHYRAAREVAPGVTSVIDIGGQDMKFMKIRGGAVDSIAVNEACSSGCGSFLQTFASTMNTGLTDFAKAGCEAEHPVDLGSRCTVFMNSSVKQAQKEGATLGDISAGLSYSVVRNALYKVIKLRDAGELGSTVVVQGGTFLNDAVLRAFELLTGVEVVRPDIAGLMGAYGAALSALPTPMAKPAFSHFVRNGTTTSRDPARNTSRDPARNTSRHPARNEVESQDLSRFNALSSLRSCDFAQDDGVKKSPDERVERLASDGVIVSPFQTRDLDAFRAESEQRTCQLCQNHCKLTITTFDDGVRNVSGNRCERGASLDRRPKKSEIPNLYDYKYQRAFGYRRLKESDAKRGDIGIPRALGMYEDYPLWFTVLTKLGFRVILSGRSNHELFEAGMESIPAENTCYPAKLAHGHIEWLLDKGIDTIWFPCVSYERKEHSDNHYNCPIVSFYPETLEHNIDRLKSVRFLDPHLNLNNPEFLAKRLVEVFADWNVTLPEAKEAVEAGYAEWDAFHADVRAEGDRALQYAREHGMRSIVLAGRPYHVDPEINHGIPDAIVKLGMAVLTEDSLREGEYVEHPMRVMDQWAYHSRLYEAAAQVRNAPDVSLVQLNSFGCGLDAITTDMVQEIIESAGDVYTVIKIDEVSNLGAATIRLRS